MTKAPAADALSRLHEQTSARFSRTLAAVGQPPGCGRGCADCCVDDLSVWQVEADLIQAWFVEQTAADANRSLQVGPTGACAFLRDGQCQIYPARPYVCRSQGAVLRWHEDDGQQVSERRDTCPLHLQDVALDALPEAALFDIGPAESTLIALATNELASRGGRGLPQRVVLRQLADSLAKGAPGVGGDDQRSESAG